MDEDDEGYDDLSQSPESAPGLSVPLDEKLDEHLDEKEVLKADEDDPQQPKAHENDPQQQWTELTPEASAGHTVSPWGL